MDGFLWSLCLVAVFLAIGGGVGRFLEMQHFKSIRARERAMTSLPTVTFVPPDWTMSESALVQGSVVVSMDYLKRFLAFFRGLVGGRMRSIEPLLERGRREALLRMKEAAIARGSSAVVNVRLETSRIASARGNGKGTSGVEVVAYGTAVRRG